MHDNDNLGVSTVGQTGCYVPRRSCMWLPYLKRRVQVDVTAQDTRAAVGVEEHLPHQSHRATRTVTTRTTRCSARGCAARTAYVPRNASPASRKPRNTFALRYSVTRDNQQPR